MNFANLLEAITANQVAAQGLAIFATVATVMLTAFGAAKLLAAGFGLLGLKAGTLSIVLPILNKQIVITATTIQTAAARFGIILAVASMVYMIVSYLRDEFGLLPAVIAAVTMALIPLVVLLKTGATAMAIMTGGAAAIAGLAAVLPLLTMPTHQVGTTFVRRTGLAYVHAGETIKSARESPDFGYLKTTGGPQRVTYNTVTVKIDTVHTKADIDDLDEKLRRAFKDYLEQKV